MALLDNLTRRFGLTADTSAIADARAISSAANQLNVYKQQMLEAARHTATVRAAGMETELGRPLNDAEFKLHGMPTLEDYRMACEHFTHTPQGQHLAENGQWNAKIYSDLGGQNITGFRITEPQKQDAKTDVNLHNRDGDGAINDFYTNVDFHGANIKDCIVDPATSFNDEIARAKTIENPTFNNMKSGDVFTFGSGQYKNVKLTNINGGEIRFDQGAQVDGIDIRGMKVDDRTRILTLEMGEGAMIADSDLREATISMASNMKGAVLQNVKIGGNISSVDMRGTKLVKVSFDKANLNELDLRGADLQDVTIDGKPVTGTEQLAALGVKVDQATKIAVNKDMKVQRQVEALAKNMTWAQDMTRPPPAPAPVAPVVEAPKIEASQANVSAGLQNASFGLKRGENLMTMDAAAVPKADTQPYIMATPAGNMGMSEAEKNAYAFKKVADSFKAPEHETRSLESSDKLIAQTERARAQAQSRTPASLPPLPGAGGRGR